MNTLRPAKFSVCASRNPRFISNARFLQMQNDVLVRLQRKVRNVKRIVYDNIRQCQKQHNPQSTTHKEYCDYTLQDDNV